MANAENAAYYSTKLPIIRGIPWIRALAEAIPVFVVQMQMTLPLPIHAHPLRTFYPPVPGRRTQVTTFAIHMRERDISPVPRRTLCVLGGSDFIQRKPKAVPFFITISSCQFESPEVGHYPPQKIPFVVHNIGKPSVFRPYPRVWRRHPDPTSNWLRQIRPGRHPALSAYRCAQRRCASP